MDVHDVLARLLANRLGLAGLLISAMVVIAALLAPVLAPAPPEVIDPLARLVPPSRAHPFGADDFGRDLLSRVLYGTRISLQVGVVAIALSTVLGLLVGIVAGYARGPVDTVLM